MLSSSLSLTFKKLALKIGRLIQNLSIAIIASCCLIMPCRALAVSQTTAAVIKISSCTELENITAGDYVLTADIDCGGRNFTPIGNTSTGAVSAFKGSLDGAGHTINNISIIAPESTMVGLFAMTDKASIKELTLNNIKIAGKSFVGTLVGVAIKTTVDNVKVQQATITIPTSIPDTYPSFIGGLVGLLGSVSSIQNSSCAVTIKGTTSRFVGGLVGSIKNSGTINHSYAEGIVEGKSVVGGLIGSLDGGKLNDSYSASTVKSYGDSAGGLIGDSYKGQVSNSYALGSVSGQSKIGGLMGGNYGGLVLGDPHKFYGLTEHNAISARPLKNNFALHVGPYRATICHPMLKLDNIFLLRILLI